MVAIFRFGGRRRKSSLLLVVLLVLLFVCVSRGYTPLSVFNTVPESLLCRATIILARREMVRNVRMSQGIAPQQPAILKGRPTISDNARYSFGCRSPGWILWQGPNYHAVHPPLTEGHDAGDGARQPYRDGPDGAAS
jgi:hypothetical protein